MKRYLITLLATLCTLGAVAKKQPEVPAWTKAKPSVPGYYVGVGSAPAYTKDYKEKAKEKALADLISDIEVKIANQSLLERLDQNGEYSEKYSNNIRSESEAWLEGYEMADSYSDETTYYVQYRLNILDYENLKKQRLAKAAAVGADFLAKGNQARREGRFHDAVELYVQGIKSIEPFANERLEANVDGVNVNVAPEFIYALSGMFSGLTFRATPGKVSVKPFNADVVPLKILAQAGGYPVAGVRLKARFSAGDGHITISGRTDQSGHTDITLRDISAKPARRELVITPQLDVTSLFNTPATEALGQRILSSIQPLYVPVTMEDTGLKACVYTTDDNVSPLLRSLSSYFSTNFFDVVDNAEDADLKITVSTSFHPGEIVKGQLYDMREYFTSCMVTIEDLNAPSKPIVIRVNIDDARSLSPVSTSATASRTTAQREMFKRIRRELDKKMAEAKFERRAEMSEESTDSAEDAIPSDF